MEIFNTSKRQFKKGFKQIIEEGDNYEIGEAALPAYSHKNPVIDWLFWERIKIAYKYALNTESVEKVLDFGCGSGILSYMLAKKGYSVTACDIEFGPLKLVRDIIDFPSDISFIEGDVDILNKELKENSFDIIFALDVLEHIDDLEPYIELFGKLLSPNGVILISGPTENAFYKIGRRLAGNRFSGDYHVTNISNVKDSFSQSMKVTTIKKLLFPVVLFDIFICQGKASNDN